MGHVTTSYFPRDISLDKRKQLRDTHQDRRIDATLLIAFIQFVVVVLLLSAASAEYQSNSYMQEWISHNAWPIGYFLNGYLASMLVGVAIGGGVLLIQKWRQAKKGRDDGNALSRR